MSPMTRVNITLDVLTLQNIDALSRTLGANRSEIIRRAVSAYIPILSAELSKDLKAALAKKPKSK